MIIQTANIENCRAIAELAMMAGEGIPGYFWAQSQKAHESIIDVGARNVSSETENFSYKNTTVAQVDDRVAGMLLAYPLPDSGQTEDFTDLPDFIQPLIELEQCVPGSYYINMLASYPEFRGNGIGTALMIKAEELAHQSGCQLLSIEVFEENTGAVKLYKRLGYSLTDKRAVIPHSCYDHGGDIYLLTKPVVV